MNLLITNGRVIDPSQDREVEIASDVADGPCSVIMEQVTNGVAGADGGVVLAGGRTPCGMK